MDSVLYLRGCRVDLVAGVVHRQQGQPLRLTSREVALLTYMARTPGQAVSVEELEQHVWEISARAVSRAVSAAVRRLRPKIEPPGGGVVNLQTVRGVGWVLHLQPPPLAEPQPLIHRTAPAASFDSFIGRSEELAELLAALTQGARLTTITGPGGVGKSRLVAEALACPAMGAVDSPELVYVNLDDASDSGDWVVELAAALGMAIGGGGLDHAVAARLKAMGPAILVLDNLDLNAADAASAVSRWLQLCPELQVVCTCRRTLKIRGERLLRLTELSEDEGCRLLCDRMLQRGVRIDPNDAPCRLLVGLLGGLPLALELAAPQACGLGVPAVVESVRVSGARPITSVELDRPERHRSLHESVAASWRLLSDEDQRLLSILAVFAGPVDPASALSVTRSEQGTLWQALGRLVDASLVVPRGGRISMPALIRRFVMDVAPPPGGALVRHAQWSLEFPTGERRAELARAARYCPDVDLAAQCAERAGEQLLQLGASAKVVELTEELLLRRPSLPWQARLGVLRFRGLAMVGPLERAARAADTLLDQEWLDGDLRVEVVAVAARVLKGAPRQLAVDRLEHAVRLDGVTPAGRALGLRVLAGRYADGGDLELAASALEQAIHIARDHGLNGHEAWCRLLRASLLGTEGAAADALDWVEHNVISDLPAAGQIDLSRVVAEVAWIAGHGRIAVERARFSADLAAREGKQMERRDALLLLGSVLAEQGLFDEARARLDEADVLGVAPYGSRLARLRLAVGMSSVSEASAALESLYPFDSDDNAPHRRLWVVEARAEVSLLGGNPGSALIHSRRAVAIADTLSHHHAVTPLVLMGRAFLALDRLEEAEEIASRALSLAESGHIPYDLGQALLLFGEVCHRGGDRAGVTAVVERCTPILAQAGCTPHSLHLRRLAALSAV